MCCVCCNVMFKHATHMLSMNVNSNKGELFQMVNQKNNNVIYKCSLIFVQMQVNPHKKSKWKTKH